MAYTAEYEAADIGEAAIDITAGSLAGVAGEADTIGLLLAIGMVLGLVIGVLGSVFGVFGKLGSVAKQFR